MVVVEDTVQLELTGDKKFEEKWSGYIHNYRKPHYMVVRSALRDGRYPLGTLVHVNGTSTVSYTFDMVKIQKQRLWYRKLSLGEVQPKSAEDSLMLKNMGGLGIGGLGAECGAKKNWMMDPTRLHLVAFVQDVHTGDVLQAQIVRVSTGPKGELLQLPN